MVTYRFKKSELTLHELVQIFSELFQDADGLRVVGPVAEVRRLDVGAVIKHDATDPLVTRIAGQPRCIL